VQGALERLNSVSVHTALQSQDGAARARRRIDGKERFVATCTESMSRANVDNRGGSKRKSVTNLERPASGSCQMARINMAMDEVQQPLCSGAE
jgi:hypothetical protein